MSSKTIARYLILTFVMLISFALPGSVLAGADCGSTYTVQWGDSLSMIAERCGTTVNALYAANPGMGYYLYAGQVLVIPGGYNCNCPQDGYSNTYIVQRGDTFAEIARRMGVSVGQLWAANPYIWNINLIYPGQIIYVPNAPNAPYPPYHPPSHEHASPWFKIVPDSTDSSEPLSYGTLPSNAPKAKIKLVNNANAEVYVSLQGTTHDGFETINEYPVDGKVSAMIPAGWYTYVAWVGGEKYVGQFNLYGGSDRTITFYTSKIVVE